MDNKEYIDQIQKLGKHFMNEGTCAWERYAKSLSGFTESCNSTDDMQKDYTQYAQTKGTEYMQKIMQCNLEYYTGLMTASLDLTNDLVDSVLKQTSGMSSKSSRAPMDETVTARAQETAAQTELHFSAKEGKKQSQSFLIANNQGSNVDVSFEISDFVSEDGKTKKRIPVSFKPDHFILEQGAEQLVECSVTVGKSLAKNQQNAALARVVGFPNMMVRLIVSSE